MNIDIALLSAENSDLLSNLAPEVFDEAIQPQFLQAFLEDPRHVMFLALDGDKVVGMASAVEYFHPDKAGQLWINEVGVTATHRRQGIGRRLVQALLAEAERRGCTSSWLGTDKNNLAGQACFGSVPESEGPQEFFLYEWDLVE